MQAYMKCAMPFLGVPMPARRKAFAGLLSTLTLDSRAEWQDLTSTIWSAAKYREEWYCAVDLATHRRFEVFRVRPTLALFEQMIVEGAWWDTVDALASHGVGGLLRRYPKSMPKTMRSWSRSDDMWKRRTSILSQLTFKSDTDLGLLYDCIEPNLESKEFFLRKAIGWSLRQYAWTDPTEVKRYCRKNDARLSPLSKREALKNVGRKR